MSDNRGQTPDWDNSGNGEDEKLRQLVNRELLDALDAPAFESRRAAIMMQVRAGTTQVGNRVPRQRSGWFGAPVWAAAMAAVFVLVVAGVLFAIIAGNRATSSNDGFVAQAPGATTRAAAATAPAAAAPAPTQAAAAGSAAGTTQDNVGNKPGTPTTASNFAAPAATAPAAATTAAAAPAIAPAPTNAPAATTAAAAATTAAASVPTGGATVAASGGQTSTATLPTYPQATLVNLGKGQVDSFLAAVTANISPDVKNASGLNLPFTSNAATYNYQSSKIKGQNAEQVADFYQKQLTPAYNLTSLVLRDDGTFKVRWLYFTGQQGQPLGGVLVVEPRQQAASDAAFGAGQLSVGETLIVRAPR